MIKMALNKSNKSTPNSRGGCIKEITASAGKATNYLLPVRIKVTPQHGSTLAPLSDGKKDCTKMMQPVLIKDLLRSTQRNQTSTFTSVSTQKKTAQRSNQPYLNTQSCYKPKEDEDAKSSILVRKSYGENKVRRQLYQNLDSPQRSTLDRKENAIKNIKTRIKSIRNSEVLGVKCSQKLNKSTKSFLLPPNSIRNSITRKSENFKPPVKESVKSNASVAHKSSKGISGIATTKHQKNNFKKSNQKVKDDIDTKLDFSSADADECLEKESNVTRDVYTMMSPVHEEATLSKSLSNLSKLGRPSVIVMSETKKVNNAETLCREMQNLNIINTTPHIQGTDFNFAQLYHLDINTVMQCKTSLEQSIQACEDQAFKLKQVLNFVNTLFLHTKTMYSKNTVETQLKTDECLVANEKHDISPNPISSNQNRFDITDIIDKSLENKAIINKSNSKPEFKVYMDEEESHMETTEKLSIPMEILITKADLNEEAKDVSSNVLSELARLPTIGEVSYELEELNKDVRNEKNKLENKENIDASSQMFLTPTVSPKIQRTPCCKSLIQESSERRRSARLAAKHSSLSMTLDTDSDKQDSFTLLEHELNVVHEVKVSSKSLPASPMKAPTTPGCIRQWDKRVERPLKEYMALKMNGTFLVTPDVKRFQSHIEPIDTPHSRKSLSRKIFMELCDLYAESPESN